MKYKRTHFARKRFGQHFLKDPKTLKAILSAAKIEFLDQVLEIGPGKGVLTKLIIEIGANLLLVEIDYDLMKELDKKFAQSSNCRLMQGDILKMDWEQDVFQHQTNWKVISNLPYNITAPVFFLFVKYRRFIKEITIMIQKEVANRLFHQGGVKNKKDYGVLSVIAQNLFNIEWVCDVSPSAFLPRPKVNSAVIQLRPINSHLEDEEKFFRFVQHAFQQRRKILLKPLRQKERRFLSSLDSATLDYIKDKRAEELSPIQFLQLYYEHSLSKQ